MNLVDIQRRLALLAVEHLKADSAFDQNRLNRIIDETVFLQKHALSTSPSNLAEMLAQISILRQCVLDAIGCDEEAQTDTLQQTADVLGALAAIA